MYLWYPILRMISDSSMTSPVVWYNYTLLSMVLKNVGNWSIVWLNKDLSLFHNTGRQNFADKSHLENHDIYNSPTFLASCHSIRGKCRNLTGCWKLVYCLSHIVSPSGAGEMTEKISSSPLFPVCSDHRLCFLLQGAWASEGSTNFQPWETSLFFLTHRMTIYSFHASLVMLSLPFSPN